MDTDDSRGSARTTELLARSYFKAAFQSGTHEEFENRIQHAESFYQIASQLYEKAGQKAQSDKSQASSIFASFWQKDSATERRDVLEKCIDLAKNAAQMSEEQGEQRLLAESRQELSGYVIEMALLATEREALRNYFEVVVKTSSEAARAFEALHDNENQLVCLDLVVRALTAAYAFEDPQKHELLDRAEILTKQMEGIAERLGTP